MRSRLRPPPNRSKLVGAAADAAAEPAPPVGAVQHSSATRLLDDTAAFLPLFLTLLVLPLASRGDFDPALTMTEGVTFGGVLWLGLRRRLLFSQFQRLLLTLLMGLATAAALSTLFSQDLEASVPNLLLWIWIGSVGVLAMSVTHKRRGVEWLVALVTIALFIQVLWSYFSWWGSLPMPQLHSGTFYAPNQYAGYVLLLAPIFLSTFLLKQAAMGKIGFGILTSLAYSSIWLSGSRGGIGAATVGALTTSFVIFRHARERFVTSLIGLALAGLIVGWGVPRLVRPAEQGGVSDRGTDKAATASSLEARMTWAGGAIRIGFERPLAGSGLGTFGDKFFQIQNPSWQWSRYAHNHYLEAFAEGGFPLLTGAVALPLMGLTIGLKSLKGWSTQKHADRDESIAWHVGALGGVAGGVAHLLVDHDWSYPAYSAAFVVLIVILTLIPRRLSSPPYLAASGAVLGAAGLLFLLPFALSSYLLTGGPSHSRLESSHLAARLAPWSAMARIAVADQLVAHGEESDLVLAKMKLSEASRIDTLDPQIYWRLGHIDSQLQYDESARASYLAAIRIVPNSGQAYVRAALFEVSEGDACRALEILRLGIRRLTPDDVQPLATLRNRLSESCG